MPPDAVICSITAAAKGGGVAQSPGGFGPDGKRIRHKVSGRTKTEVKDKLQLVHDELRDGIRSSPRYTVQDAVDDFLAHGLEGRSAKTISTIGKSWRL